MKTRTRSPLAVLRFTRGLSQADLGSMIDRSADTISRIERGDRPSLATARALARTLEVSVEFLFPEDEA